MSIGAESQFLMHFIFQLTVNSLADFFKTEKGVDLEVLTTATLSKLEEIKEKTATGQWFTILSFLKAIGEKRRIPP